MESIMNMGWLGKSITCMICVIPLMLMFNFFGKNYGVRPEALMCAWFIGTFIGIGLSMWGFKVFDVRDLYNPILPLLLVVVLGIFVGAPANILLAQAVPSSPNPALPFAIVNTGSAFAYILAPAMPILLPRYFNPVNLNWVNFTGILLVAGGLGLVMFKPS